MPGFQSRRCAAEHDFFFGVGCCECANGISLQVDIGLAADVGTLQRLPRIVANGSIVRELALTGRRWPAAEAASQGFLSRIHSDQPTLAAEALSLAKEIASKSPVAVQVRCF